MLFSPSETLQYGALEVAGLGDVVRISGWSRKPLVFWPAHGRTE
jgi:hypothetical protein